MIPGKATDPVQYIDVRDVGEWMIRLGEDKMAGTYNAVGPKTAESISDFVHKAKSAFVVESTFVQVDDYDFLNDNQVYYIVPWIMPDKYNFGSARVDNKKALNAGLKIRDLKESINDLLEWWNAQDQERREKFEKDPKGILLREEEILRKWKAIKKG